MHNAFLGMMTGKRKFHRDAFNVLLISLNADCMVCSVSFNFHFDMCVYFYKHTVYINSICIYT